MLAWLAAGFAVVIISGLVVFYVHSRRVLREAKNYERGLKMVPLLIHLPPPSEDLEANGRDQRDVAEENISKAQTLYDILSSTAKKGFKMRLYGQRHMSFEIIASKGFVYFYVAVPVALVPVVEQAVTSAYPSARLEEVAEHNIFSPVGKISGTIGGELVLKEDYSFPISTYQEIKRDTMQSLLNALSTLQSEDGAGIQILIRPARTDWRKHATILANKKRKGTYKKKKSDQAIAFAKQLAVAPVRPPEDKKDSQPPKQLSTLEQAVVDSIDDKTRHPGFEVLIRLVASSNISQRAQTILNSMVASFALFESPGRNGFKYTAAKDIESFVTAYILRFFPQNKDHVILNTTEMATLFHFPDQSNIPTTQLERQASKQVDGPRNIADSGLALGYNVFRGTKKRINISVEDRLRHMYIIGQTGTGKSTLLENLALQDMLNGDGFAFIDPHGDTAEKILGMVPRERTEDVIYFCPAEMDYPLGLNLFEFDRPEQKDFLIQEAINMLYKLYDPQHQGIIGPRYEHWFRNAALTLMSDPQGSTFIDIPKVFTDNQYAKQKLKHVTDQTVLEFWNKEMAQTSDYHKSEVLGWFVSKFGAFLSNEMMRNIIGQTRSAFNLRQVMDERKILIVNLSKGRTGELNSKLLGMMFVMKFQAAAMSRADMDAQQRVPFCLYVDEFQNFSTDSFADILSEARKYGLNLVVANQYIGQLTDEIRDAVFGNVGTIVAFRVGTSDAEFLAKQFAPVFDVDDLQRVPNANAVVRMLIGGIPTQPFSMATLPPLGSPNKKLVEALKQLSSAKYGRPKAVVEAEIFERLRTTEPLKTTATPRNIAQPGSTATSSASSFLDDWLAKRQARLQASGQTAAVADATPAATAQQAASSEPTEPTLMPETPQPTTPTTGIPMLPSNDASSTPYEPDTQVSVDQQTQLDNGNAIKIN